MTKDLEERKTYFVCVSCRCGDHDRIMEDGHIEKQRNHFEPKKGDIIPVRKGDFIDFKGCPNCGEKTLIRD